MQRRDNARWEPPGGVLELGETLRKASAERWPRKPASRSMSSTSPAPARTSRSESSRRHSGAATSQAQAHPRRNPSASRRRPAGAAPGRCPHRRGHRFDPSIAPQSNGLVRGSSRAIEPRCPRALKRQPVRRDR
ncbi:hypothetical protein [Pseudonocardia humida]|uniref:hypothetical protein n=1 Tax=Pseudonocardia humida TaxID=2800819 RepID=UPI0035573735